MSQILSHRRRSSTRALRRALVEMDGHYGRGSEPRLRHLLRPLGAQTSALAAAVLALPFLSPVSLGPITTAASVLIALLGVQLLRRREGAPLPERFLDVAVPRTAHRAMSSALRHTHRWMQRISRPRLPHLVEGGRGQVLCGAGIVSGALLLAVPIPLLPLTNTFPALGILLFALGRLERDGVLTVLGSAALLLSAAIFAALGATLYLFGWEAIHAALPFVSDRG